MTLHGDNLLLAGDVGGTKTVLAVLSQESGTTANLAEAVFENRSYGGFEEVVTDFLTRFRLRVNRASFSVAGPVIDGAAVLSNLAWELNSTRLCDVFGWTSVELINDLQATAYALPHLSPEDLYVVQPGAPRNLGPRAVIAPGTGLGESFLVWSGARFEAHPSEGGNADFAPADRLQLELLGFLQDRFGHVSYEMVCSGVGIPNLYAFLKETGRASEPAWLAERLAEAVDPTPVIVNSALDPAEPAPICVEVLSLFARILAAEAGNLALRVLPTGGVYVGGGIPPRILSVLQRPEFLEAFRSKGRFVELMQRFPVYVVLEPRAALLGAGHFGLGHHLHETAAAQA
jgi:glucokinase